MTHTRTGRPRQAAVIGGSLAGLVTARVLADHLDHVVVIEQDLLPDTPAHRRFVPQSHHAHGLLGSGARVLAELFPGWAAQVRMQALAARTDAFALGERPAYIVRGATVVKAPIWWAGGVAGSRILLEHSIRERVAALPNVELRDGVSATGLLTASPDPGRPGHRADRVVGVRTSAGDIPAHLVVDAAGRRSGLPDWLEGLGYDRPRVEAVHMPVHYASCLLQPDDGFDPEWFMVLGGSVGREGVFRGAVILPVEGGRYLCTLGAVGADAALPVEPDAYLAFARTLPAPYAAEVIERSTMVTAPRRFRVPSNRFLRYDRLRRRPAGVVAVGDAVAAFNPIYGQGMSVAARSAVALGRVLAEDPDGIGAGDGRLERRVARAVADVVRPAWSLAVSEDLRAPGRVEGVRGVRLRRAGGWYRDRLERAAGADPEVALAFNDVVHLHRPVTSLVAPRIARRVLLPRARPTAPVPATTPLTGRSASQGAA